MRRLLWYLLPATVAFGQSGESSIVQSALMRAMTEEMDRAKTLAIANLDAPYYIEYTVEDVHSFSTSATLGGSFGTTQNRFRVPRVRVRVGSYDFDNSNYIYSDYYAGSRYDSELIPIDDNYSVLRRSFWLATDRAYKTAVEAIARKRAALKNVTQSETLPDFWKAKPLQEIRPPRSMPETSKWPEQVRRLSRIFMRYPEVTASSVAYDASNSTLYFLNSEGSTLRLPDALFLLRVRASGQAADGSTVRDAVVLAATDMAKFPESASQERAITQVADNVKALAKAPLGETYSGPVLFENFAAAQLIADVLGPNLALPRRPVGEPGRTAPVVPSELEGRIGSRILPEFLDVVDDPKQTAWEGRLLLGSYEIDEEAVPSQAVTLIEKGRLKSFLLTRQPVKGSEGSNGHARMPGPFGARTATTSNLFVRASESLNREDLLKKMVELVQARNKPYGLIIRKLDFPSSASGDEVRRMMAASTQRGSSRHVSMPLLVYRVYPDGKEELVRGLRFRGVSVRALRDIIAAGQDSTAFHYLNNLAPFAMMGAGRYVAPSSVIAPSLLFDDLELERPPDDLPKPPIVPPPALNPSS